MLAKHDTPMNARSTTDGRVPARLSTRVISTRSMFDLLSAAAIVKPPISSRIVGENMTEQIHLEWSMREVQHMERTKEHDRLRTQLHRALAVFYLYLVSG